MLTALYDLAKSPLTFDFIYAVIQAELERRRRGCDRLRMHIRLDPHRREGWAYDQPERDWRLRHVLYPLAQCLGRPVDVWVGPDMPAADDAFDVPQGLHWLSDVVSLAEAGENVQILTAAEWARHRVLSDLDPVIRGRRIITITLREALYAVSRNSDPMAWSATARNLDSEGYAVIVLRDLERVNDPLGPGWGNAITYAPAVWDVGLRTALYEIAWLNLGVNNGPSSLLIFNKKAKFVLFKMLGGTPDSDAQHFHRLGIEPHGSFPFLGDHQRLVWDGDHFPLLEREVARTLDALERGVREPVVVSRTACASNLVVAARHEFRSGRGGATTLSRIRDPEVRRKSAIELANMYLDEGRPLDAAHALTGAPVGPERQAVACAIAHSRPSMAIVAALSSLVDHRDPDWLAAIRRIVDDAAQPSEVGHRGPVLTLVIGKSLLAADEVLRRVAAADAERERRNLASLRVFAACQSGLLASVAALFPALDEFAAIHGQAGELGQLGGARIDDDTILPPTYGRAMVPAQATLYFSRWRRANGLHDRRYGVIAELPDNQGEGRWASAEREWRDQGIVSLKFDWFAASWPLEMLAALLGEAAALRLNLPLARALADVLGLAVE